MRGIRCGLLLPLKRGLLVTSVSWSKTRCRLGCGPVMLTRPAGHEAKAEARKSEAEDEAPKKFEAEARHVREQLSVYEHED